MRTTGRRLAAMATVGGVLAALMSGCSGPSSSGGDDADVITMWTFKQNEVAALQAVGDAWTKTSGIKLEVTAYTPDDTYTTKVRSAARTNGLPDIVSAHAGNEDWQFAAAGILQDITDEFDEAWSSQLIPSVLATDTLTQEVIDSAGSDPSTSLESLAADHTYSVPYLAGTPGVVYTTKEALSIAGLDGPPATWEEWIDAITATIAADSQNGGLVTGLQVPQTGMYWIYRPMSYAYLGRDAYLARDTNGQSQQWTDEANVETFRYYDQLTPLWSPGVLALGIDQADQAFAQGKAAWDVGGTFTFGALAQNGVSADDIVTFPIPAPQGSEVTELTYAPSALISAGVSSSTTHREEAISFLKYLSSPEGAVIFANEASDVPATQLDASEVTNPLVKQMLGLFPASSDVEAFNPNDQSSMPGGGVGNLGDDLSTVLAQLPAETATPEDVAKQFTDMYRAAWSAQG